MRLLLASLLVASAPAAAASMGEPRLDYVLNCAGCHGLAGMGVPDKGVPRLKGAVGKLLHVPDGRAFIAQAPGVANSALKDDELARLLNWLLPEMDAANLPAGSEPYTAEEVTALRRARRGEYLARRAALVEALAAKGIVLDDYGS
jgi:mono/diheme cytochrome c family protein